MRVRAWIEPDYLGGMNGNRWVIRLHEPPETITLREFADRFGRQELSEQIRNRIQHIDTEISLLEHDAASLERVAAGIEFYEQVHDERRIFG